MRVLMIVLLSLCTGAIAAACLLPGPGTIALAVCLLLGSVCIHRIPRLRSKRFLMVCICSVLGLLYGFLYQQFIISPAQALYGTTATYRCEVMDYPQATKSGCRVPVRLITGSTPRATVYLHPAVALVPGDSFTAELKLTDSASGGSFYGYSDGVFINGSAKELQSVTTCDRIQLRFLPKYIAHTLEDSLRHAFPEDTLGYALALTTGNRSDLSAHDKSILQRAGIFHAMALSGMHMSILVGCLLLLKRRKKIKALLGIPLCIAFVIITGSSPSVVRAAVLQCLLLGSGCFRRETDAPTSLSVAAAILILQNPWVIASWGAQLSFASVIGLLLFGRRLYLWLLRPVPRNLIGSLWKPIAAACSATFSALSLTIPFLIFDFGYISVIAPITNLLCGGVVAFCFAGSLLTALLGSIFPKLAILSAIPVDYGFRYLRLVSELLSRIPFSSIYSRSGYFLFWLFLVYGILILFFLQPKLSKRLSLSMVVLTFFLCVLLTLFESLTPSFTALNVGQGQCLLFRSKNATAMVDCGSAQEDAGTIAADHLMSIGENELDILILTHYDSDHVNGVAELLNRVKVKQLILPSTDSEMREEIESLAIAKHIAILHADDDLTVHLGRYPLYIYAPDTRDHDNDSCLTILSMIPGLTTLITGDLSGTAEQTLLEAHPLPALDLLVAGHHGSKGSTTAQLLQATTPKAVIISVGKNNYGHPAEETLQRISRYGAIVYRTDADDDCTSLSFYASRSRSHRASENKLPS